LTPFARSAAICGFVRIHVASAVSAMGAACLLAMCAGASAVAQDVSRPALPVSVETVTHLERAEVDETFAGVITARRESLLGFESGGRIAQVNVDLGDRVAEGDVLAALDLRTIDAEVAASEASVDEARANLVLARATAGRQADLVDRGHVSQQAFDEVQANVDAGVARVLASEARLEFLRARRELAVLIAPYAGVITARRMDEGTVAGPGVPVVELVEADVLEMRVGLPVRRARALSHSSTYVLSVGGRDVDAVFRASTDVVDRATQTVAVVFDIADTRHISAGEVARVALPVEIEADGFWAPMTALSEGRRGLWTVFALVSPDDEPNVFRVEPRIVEVLYTEADRVFVRGSVRDGEQIVIEGLDRIVPGQRVRPTQTGRAVARVDVDR